MVLFIIIIFFILQTIHIQHIDSLLLLTNTRKTAGLTAKKSLLILTIRSFAFKRSVERLLTTTYDSFEGCQNN